MTTLRLSWRLLVRDWRAGELRVLMAALVLAVASVGTVGFFADRVKLALTEQANLLLGADMMISGDRPLPDAFAAEATRRGLAVLPVIRFNSMVQSVANSAGGAVLTDVKAVAEGYPLRGAIWIDTRLAQRLGVKAGDKLAVGEATPTVRTIFAQEPEIAGITFALGPKLLLNIADVPSTNLLQPGNRATWRLLVAERDGRTLPDFRAWLNAQLAAGQRV